MYLEFSFEKYNYSIYILAKRLFLSRKGRSRPLNTQSSRHRERGSGLSWTVQSNTYPLATNGMVNVPTKKDFCIDDTAEYSKAPTGAQCRVGAVAK